VSTKLLYSREGAKWDTRARKSNLHQKIERDARESYCIIDARRQSGKHSIQACNAECRYVDKQEIDEEFGGIHVETGQEVLKNIRSVLLKLGLAYHDDREWDDLNQQHREILEDSGDNHGGRSIESIVVVSGSDSTTRNLFPRDHSKHASLRQFPK
jgi:hypothetical protein